MMFVSFANLKSINEVKTTTIIMSTKTMVHKRCLFLAYSVLVNVSLVESNRPIFFLDVDNTLYSENIHRIEEQIRSNLYAFCEQTCGLTVAEADALHHQYGSTIEGLQQLLWKNEPHTVQSFYDAVYQSINCSSLLQPSTASNSITGYSDLPESSQLRQILINTKHPIEIASNSPLVHVQKVWQGLGLARVQPTAVRTPTTLPGYPTKMQRDLFFAGLHPNRTHVLLDDSEAIVRNYNDDNNKDDKFNLSALLVQDNLLQVLATASGWIDNTLSDVEYLRDKNRVDEQSIDVETWHRMLESLATVEEPLVVVDVGAGLLHMLRLLFVGTDRLEPLNHSRVDYVAFESNRNLKPACIEMLTSLGFQKSSQGSDGMNHVFLHRQRNWRVDLSFSHYKAIDKVPHLIVGSCFADLFEPNTLATSLLRTFLCEPADFSFTTIYFPITFAGVTAFLPPQPFQGNIPSDTLALRIYTEALKTRLGHTVDPSTIEASMLDYGAQRLHRHGSRSDWVIEKDANPIFWKSMMYFFGMTAAPELDRQNWDAKGWLDRARKLKPTIRVSNTDLLFRIPHLGKWEFARPKYVVKGDTMYHELLFKSPRKVKVVRKPVLQRLRPNDIRVHSECSLISSGTELKVFQGKFDDAALDVNIKGMDEERMAYPLSYGYCLVGHVVECGADATEMLGKLVFAFAAHASEVVTEQSAVQVVPDGIDAFDAIFMPSMETALSLVQEACPILGENVGVFGQGLIGLLVTAILQLQHPQLSGDSGTVSTFDTLEDRLMASATMGASQSLFPSSAQRVGQFDVTIEVSGNGRALQAAIDTTSNGGRIIVGSWYGTDAVNLKLGMDFHRSHKTLIASQVSEIPAAFGAAWTKKRRFGLTWELVKRIRPSRLLTKLVSLDDAQGAYEDLEKGRQLAVAFLYK